MIFFWNLNAGLFASPLLILAPGSSLNYSEILICLGYILSVPLQFGGQNGNKHVSVFLPFFFFFVCPLVRHWSVSTLWDQLFGCCTYLRGLILSSVFSTLPVSGCSEQGCFSPLSDILPALCISRISLMTPKGWIEKSSNTPYWWKSLAWFWAKTEYHLSHWF